MKRDMTTVAQGSWVERIAKLQDSKQYAELHWEGGFEEYLNLVRQNPRVTRTAFQRIYDMILSHGKTEYIDNKKKLIRYHFFSDERFVPPDHPDSNYHMARQALIKSIQPRKVFAIPTDGDPDSAADRYDEILRQQYGASVLDPAVPLFHLTLLGLGDDGHTASLLPGQPVLEEKKRWASAVPQGRPEPRITLTYPALNSSRLILFLVAGQDKAAALKRARAGELPAGGLKPQGEVIWLVDQAAAG